jgi:hypothetical protein
VRVINSIKNRNGIFELDRVSIDPDKKKIYISGAYHIFGDEFSRTFDRLWANHGSGPNPFTWHTIDIFTLNLDCGWRLDKNSRNLLLSASTYIEKGEAVTRHAVVHLLQIVNDRSAIIHIKAENMATSETIVLAPDKFVVEHKVEKEKMLLRYSSMDLYNEIEIELLHNVTCVLGGTAPRWARNSNIRSA